MRYLNMCFSFFDVLIEKYLSTDRVVKFYTDTIKRVNDTCLKMLFMDLKN